MNAACLAALVLRGVSISTGLLAQTKSHDSSGVTAFIDVSVILPGFADMHTHLAYAGGRSPEARESESVRVANAERELFVMLANGITTIRNVDFRFADEEHSGVGLAVIRGPSLLGLKARAAVGTILSPRIYTSANWRLDSTKSVDENIRFRAARLSRASGLTGVRRRGPHALSGARDGHGECRQILGRRG